MHDRCVYDNMRTWTAGLSVEESIRMTEDRDEWRKYVHGVANTRIEDGYRTERTEQVCVCGSLARADAATSRLAGFFSRESAPPFVSPPPPPRYPCIIETDAGAGARDARVPVSGREPRGASARRARARMERTRRARAGALPATRPAVCRMNPTSSRGGGFQRAWAR